MPKVNTKGKISKSIKKNLLVQNLILRNKETI